MKNFFQILTALALFIISFLYTDKAITVVRELDELMIKIKDEKQNYEIKPIDAIITNDEIIPGLNGKIIDETKSYRNMKRINQFTPNLLEYKQISPNISLTNNYQKYITMGNPKKNTVTLIFLVTDTEEVETLLQILDQKKVKANFFVDGNWLEENNEQTNKIVKHGNILGSLSYKNNYNDINFTWLSTIIKQLSNQKNNYCYMEVKNKDYLKICSMYKNYTIKPNLPIKENPVKEVKEKIKAGSIISFSLTDSVLDELGTVINFIKAKGYKIVTLDEHLSEQLES